MITKEKEQMLQYYNLGLSAYKQRKWDDAIKAFEMALKIDPNDKPSSIYVGRAQNFLINPPGDEWDGITTMTEK